jgi:hypothetical protein
MKKFIFLGLIILLTIGSYTQEKKSPIEGAWQMVYGTFANSPFTFPAQVKGSQMKMWSSGYFSVVGHYEMGTIVSENYVGGKYKLDGNKYEEELVYFPEKSSIGQKVRLLLEIRNDTLIQKWPADENWKLAEQYRIEKYVRLK